MTSFYEHEMVLTVARELAENCKPDAGISKHAAFAGAVAYLVTGDFDDHCGPSVRERAVERLYIGGYFSFEEAINLLLDDQGLIFGPLTAVHFACWSEDLCYDNDPDDAWLLASLN